MKKMTAAMAALGVVAGLGAAALPLASYASEATVPVTAIIDDALSINITDATTADDLGADGVLIEGVTPGGAVESRKIAVTVSGNDTQQKYKLTLEDRLADTALINANNERIETLTTTGALNADTSTSAWGYAVSNSVSAEATSYKGVPARNNPVQLLSGSGNTGTIAANGKATTYVSFGVYAAEGQQPGRYTSDVIFTASVAN